jgi:hypothetical protein
MMSKCDSSVEGQYCSFSRFSNTYILPQALTFRVANELSDMLFSEAGGACTQVHDLETDCCGRCVLRLVIPVVLICQRPVEWAIHMAENLWRCLLEAYPKPKLNYLAK